MTRERERIVVGGALPGTVEWLDESYAIVRCLHPHPLVVYEAACHEGADLDDIEVSTLTAGVYRVGPAEEDD